MFLSQLMSDSRPARQGEHIGGKKNTLRHVPADFTVPLVREYTQLRQLWTDAAGDLAPKFKPLDALPVLDVFSAPSSMEAVRAAGSRVLTDRLRAQLAGGAQDAWGAARASD